MIYFDTLLPITVTSRIKTVTWTAYMECPVQYTDVAESIRKRFGTFCDVNDVSQWLQLGKKGFFIK
jgi:hypothetical protein